MSAFNGEKFRGNLGAAQKRTKKATTVATAIVTVIGGSSAIIGGLLALVDAFSPAPTPVTEVTEAGESTSS